MIISKDDPRQLHPRLAVLDAEGRELVVFPPPFMFTGEISVHFTSITVEGNRAFVVLSRSIPGDGRWPEREVLVYQIEEDSVLRLVRRFPFLPQPSWLMALPDGTVFHSFAVLQAYLPGSAEPVDVWTPSDTDRVKDERDRRLLVGPFTP